MIIRMYNDIQQDNREEMSNGVEIDFFKIYERKLQRDISFFDVVLVVHCLIFCYLAE